MPARFHVPRNRFAPWLIREDWYALVNTKPVVLLANKATIVGLETRVVPGASKDLQEFLNSNLS